MEAKLYLTNVYHKKFNDIPFTYGIPVPQGLVKSPEEISLFNAKGEQVPVSVQIECVWPDGSIKWALLDFLGNFEPSEKTVWTIRLGAKATSLKPKCPLFVFQKGNSITVDNGLLRATFDAEKVPILQSIVTDGVDIISSNNLFDIVAVSTSGKIFKASMDPTPKLCVEEQTDNRVVVRWDGGLFSGDGTRMSEFRLKFHFFANNRYIKMEHTLINREMPERGIFLREYRIEMPTAMERFTTKVVRQRNHSVDYFSRLVSIKQNVTIYVPNEKQCKDSDIVKQANYPAGILGTLGKCLIEDVDAFQENFSAFPHFLRPDAPRVQLGGGYAIVFPYIGIIDKYRSAVVSFLRMCPQYPKAIRVDENKITFDIWPQGAGDLRICRGMSKTHHIALSFFGRTLTMEEIDDEAVRREDFNIPADPIQISLDPQYVRQTKLVEADRILEYRPDLYPKLEAKIDSIVLHGEPLAFSGMIDYGEKNATNNEEDQGYEYAMEYYRSGKWKNYCKLIAQMLHNSTVDVVCWDPDPLRMGGTPYHTVYHQDAVCVTSHTWTEGMFVYAFISGDREAYKAAVGICDWILRWIEAKPHIVSQDGREIGWPIIALNAGYNATNNKKYLDAAFQLVEFYKEKIKKYGRLANMEPPGTNYYLTEYGEYAGFEGMHKLWLTTKDESLRLFALEVISDFLLNRGHIQFASHGRFMDMYALYAAYDMSRDKKWLDLAKKYLPLVLGRKDWNGYFYRRIMHFLQMCHEHGLINDEWVTLNQ